MTTIINDIANKDASRRKDYSKFLNLYNGDQWQGRARRGEKRLTFNYIKTAIDKMTSYLTDNMTIAVDPQLNSTTVTERAQNAETVIARLMAALSLPSLIYNTEVDAAILGDGCYKVTWDDARGRVRITAPDVQGIFVWTAPDDYNEVVQVAAQYPLPADSPSAKAPKRTEIWTEQAFEVWDNNALVTHSANPYGFIPFIVFPNIARPKTPWGESDITGIEEPQKEINRAFSQLSHILEVSGNPIAVLENIAEAEDIAVKPGAVWALPEDAKAYLIDLLQGGGVRLHIDYINMLYGAFHDISETPKTAWAKDERDLSGVALEIEMQPLIQRMKRKRLIRDKVYRTLFDYALRLIQQHTGEIFDDVLPRVVWGSSLPRDKAREIDNECRMIEKGLRSRVNSMEALGIPDPSAEFNNWLKERALILAQTSKHGKPTGSDESASA